MTRVLHTGDTHLGYRQYHVDERREDFLAAFRQVAEDAVDLDVDAVVHAGDLFHDRRPTLSDIMGALSVLRTLSEAGVPFLAVVGNHEGKRRAQWLDLFEDLGLATRLGREPVTVGGVALYGLDFVPRSKRSQLDYDFADHDAAAAALVSHGLFEPFPHGDWDARTVLERADVAFDAMLLGDDHTPQTRRLSEPHEVVLTYCGSTERVSADERDERGYNLVDVDGGVDVRRRGLETRPFVYVDVETEPGEGSQRVRERVAEEELTDAVVVVTIAGDGDPVTPAEIEAFARERGALVARVTDRRELADEADLDVAFAEPDQVVRERIAELGLSPAARDVDETIRASKVADSAVADAVEDAVRGLIEEGDPGEFAAAPPADDSEAGETGRAGDDEPAAAPTDDDQGAEATADEEDAPAGPSPEGPAGEDGDDQATMEEYL